MIARRLLVRALIAAPIMAPLVGCRARGARSGRGLLFILTPSHENPFFKAEADAAAARARALGYEAMAVSHDDDVAKQDRLIDTAIARGASALIVDNAGAAASITALRRAKAAGIPAFLMDRAIARDGVAVAQIIADGDGGAAAGARELLRLMGGKGTYVELVGRESDTNAQIRSGAYARVLDAVPGLTRAARVSANWSQSEAFMKMETLLQRHRDLQGVMAGNDTMALGAAAALKAAGVRGVHVVGFDGSPDALAAIRRGELSATVLQPAVRIAELTVEQADTYLRTGTTGKPERQSVPCELVTKKNVDEFALFARR